MVSGEVPPNSHENAAAVVDPRQVYTLPELATALDKLRGPRSYSDLDRAVGGHGRKSAKGSVLKSSTVSNLLNGKSVPSQDTVVLFLTACGLPQRGQEPWLAAWERVGTAHLRQPAGTVRVRDAEPRRLGVHASIQVDQGIDDLPAYVPRDIDTDLRTALNAARDRGGFVLVKGSSSVGKTRALFEAVKRVWPDWWLFHPADAAAVRAFADAPAPRTVVWLDELQRYLNQPGGVPASALRALLVAKLLVVGTLWPGEYTARTALRTPGMADPHAEDRELLGLAQIIEVPDTFSTAEQRRAEDLASDRRVQVALNARDAGLTQVLAAGPELVRWWEHADVAESAPCYGKAVITAALDARRVGVTAEITREFLIAAASAYLSSARQAVAPPDWFEQAISYATTPLRGATACLTPVAASLGQVAGWMTADYLYQHARRMRRTQPVPDRVWQALIKYHHPDDTLRLAENAQRRGSPEYAIVLYRRKAEDTGDWSAARQMIALLCEQGRIDAAIIELRQKIGRGDDHFVPDLANLLSEQGRIDEAIALLQQKVDAGNLDAIQYLAKLLAKHDSLDEAIAMLSQRAVDGSYPLASSLSQLLVEHGRVGEAITVLQREVDAGDFVLAGVLGEVLAQHGRDDEAVLLLRQSVDSGDHASVGPLFYSLLVEQGRIDELRQRANGGNRSAIGALARLHAKEGRLDEVRHLARSGNHAAGRALIKLLADQGRVDELRVRAKGGLASLHLASLLVKEGNIDELRQRAADGDTYAVDQLANWLVGTGRGKEAVTLLQRMFEDGQFFVARHLSSLLVKSGRIDDAIAVLRKAIDADERNATSQLMELLIQDSRSEDIRAEILAGTPGAIAALAQLSGQRR